MAQRNTSTSELVFNKDSEEVTFSAASLIQFQSGPNKRCAAVALGVGVVLAITGLVMLVLALTTARPSGNASNVTGKSEQLPPTPTTPATTPTTPPGTPTKSLASSTTPTTPGGGEDRTCVYSAEAQRVELASLLQRAQRMYYNVNSNEVPWQPDIDDLHHHVKSNYKAYNPDPEFLKNKTDAALKLLDEINAIQIDTDKLKPREHKALEQMKHFLQHVFGVPYAENYYAGDWMMGPDLFCWQPICAMSHGLNAYAWSVKPKTYEDIQQVIDAIMEHKTGIDRYRENVKMGIFAGMVRPQISCRAGVDALKTAYKQLSLANSSSAVLTEWYTNRFLQESYLEGLEKGVDGRWTAERGKNVKESIKAALKDGFGEPMLELINYLEFDHMRHCVPNDVASGLANLPLDFVYVDGAPDRSQPTTKKLPTGEALNGSHSYSLILSYFTTTDISAPEIYEKGWEQLKLLYGEVKKLTLKYTGKTNETEAVKEFKRKLNSSEMWHNNSPFPANESDENAHKTCVSPETAEKFCPVRWAAINRWANYCRYVMSMLAPKFQSVFYYAGEKVTAPNCPVEMLPHYNPSNGAQFYIGSDSRCSRPCYFGLPFFLKDYGPIFQEWSVTGHETRPGHHTQVQGLTEHFGDKCGGVPGWLNSNTYYTAFTEGWGLYSENPIISDDTDTYKDSLLQTFGMLKWQVWRAVRLIVDTGLHSRGMTRTEALKMFEDYAWDTSDFAVKEVTRYQSNPGQATAYMLGRLELMNMRKKVENATGKEFDLQDFHYQVLSQGSAPLSFLRSHVDKYIGCLTRDDKDKQCEYIMRKESDSKSGQATTGNPPMPPRPPRRHYV